MKEIEIINKRRPREKHFLQEDGTIVARIYDYPVHYLKNNKFEEIDNSLVNYKESYTNITNNYSIFFNKINRKSIFSIIKDNNFLDVGLIGDNGVIPKILRNNKYHDEIFYREIINNVDLKYDLYSDRIKESIYIKNKKISDILFSINTNLELYIDTDNKIIAKNNETVIFEFEKLVIYDSNKSLSKNFFYELYKDENGYILKVNIDKEWIQSDLRQFPVIIDPTIIVSGSNELIDTYIFNGDTNNSVYLDDKIKVGCEMVNGNQTINRALLKFDLPSISTGCKIIESKLKLISYPNNAYNYGSRTLEIHRITEPWNESNAKWDNMYDKYEDRVDSRFEAVISDSDIEPIVNEADITQLVDNWYLNDNNYGILIKATDETEHIYPVSTFYSKDNNFIDKELTPVLEIKYINQNGLIDYMNYIENGLVDGVSYINTFNGNHIININLLKTFNNNFPINLSLFYNTNDSILNNCNEYGRGFKLNYNQFLNIDLNSNIISYTDESGYIHYFYSSKEYVDENGDIVEISEENKYYDGDYMDLVLTYDNNKYILEDKFKNKLYFDTIIGTKALLTKIVSKDNDVINILYNEDYLLSNIYNESDSIIINYDNNNVLITYNLDSVILSITNNMLSSIIKNGSTISFTYNSNSIIETIKDENNLKYYYEYYSKLPFRIKKVKKLGVNSSNGEFYSIKYGFNSTFIVDQNNVSKTLTFNDNGCLLSVNRQSNYGTLKDSYGKKYLIGTYYQQKNKIISESGLIKYTKNYLQNSSFENQNNIFTLNGNGSLSIEKGNSADGIKSLRFISNENNCKINHHISLEKNNNYCFSAYLKNSNLIKLKLYYFNSLNETILEEKIINVNNTFERYGLSIFYSLDAISDLYIEIESLSNDNQIFVDNIQLEDGKTINNYNMIYNSDFSNGFNGWDVSLTDIDGNSINYSNKIKIVNINNVEKAIKIKMSPIESSVIDAEIPISGVTGDKYNISFWYKNEGIKCDEIVTYNNVIVGFKYLDEIGHCIFPSEQLSINSDSWQFFSYEFVAENDYSSITLSIFQSFNANNLYITNVGLYKNIESNLYSNDFNGNIISKKFLNDNIEKYTYDDNNQLVSLKENNSNVCYYEYEKSNNNRIKSVKSDIGLSLNYSYSNNNLSQIKTTATAVIDIDTNICYILRIKGINNYLGIENNKIKIISNSLIKWVIESTKLNNEVLFKIKNNILNNKYLNVFDENAVLCGDNNNNSLFYIVKNEDGSFCLKSYITGKNLRVENINNNFYITANDNGELLKIYFENCDNDVIEADCKYNNDNNIFSEENHLNCITSYEYSNKLISKIHKPNKNIINYEYDEYKRIKKVNDGIYIVSYSYNQNGMLDKIIYGNDIFSFEYDDFLNLENVKINNRILINKKYDNLSGKIEKITYGNMDEISFIYDEFDRLVELIKNDDNYQIIYNNLSKLGKIISNNINIDIVYDLAERIKTYEYNDLTTYYEYDLNDNIIRKKNYINNENFEFSYEYNSDNTIKQINFENNILEYSYDKLGRIVSYKHNNFILGNYNYESNGYRNSILIKNMNALDNYKYIYDNQGNISKIFVNGILRKIYKYDKSEQLIKTIDYKNNTITKYKYDNQGNVYSRKSFRFDNSILSYVKYNYNSGQWSSLLTNYNGVEIAYDQIGNPIQIGQKRISWKNGNELYSYIDENNSYIYNYDYNGNRIKKTINGIPTYYYWENNQLILEKNNNHVIYYIRDSERQLVGFKYDNNYYFYIFNGQNDVVGILNSNNERIVSYEYDDWGKIIDVIDTSNIELAKINPYRYRSYYYDEETKLYYLNSRYYNPEWGRFISPDPFIGSSEDIVGYNLFVYCNNNPINNSDSSGSFLKKLVSGIKKVSKKIYNSVKSAIVKDDNSKDVIKDTSKKAVKACVKPETTSNKSTINIKKSGNINKLPTRDIPNSTRTKPNGDTRTYGPDGKATHDIDKSHPEHHPDLPNPHAHEWSWEGDRPTRGPAIDPKDLKDKAEAMAITIGAGYIIYRVVRVVPSLFPGLWWTLPANFATP